MAAGTPSIDNIFDDDIEITQVERSTGNDGIEVDDDAPPPRRARQSLFLADSDDEMDIDSVGAQPRNVIRPPPPNDLEVDNLFGEFDDFDDIMPSAPLDEDAMMREAEARARKTNLHEILPSSSPMRNIPDEEGDGGNLKFGQKKSSKGPDGDGDEKKAKRRVMKLDENRLLGPSGFPQLIKMTKDFKIKGKGHEATDLNRLLQVYQYWTHQLYPKTPFKDTVERVEKLTHSRRMHVALSVWKDEAKGIVPKHDIDESEDENEEGNQSDNDTRPLPRQSDRPSSGRSSPLPASSPPLSPRVIMPDENDDARRRASDPAEAFNRGDPEPLFLEDEDDQALWNAMEEIEAQTAPSVPPSAPISGANSSMEDDDEDLWNMANEMHDYPVPTNAQARTVTTSGPLAPLQITVPGPPDDEDEDDMYV